MFFDSIPILSLITFIPLFGALILAGAAKFGGKAGREQLDKNAPRVALVVSGAVFLLSLLLTFEFDSAKAGFQFVQETPWLGGGIEYRVGVDGCLLYTSPSPRDQRGSRMPSSA